MLNNKPSPDAGAQRQQLEITKNTTNGNKGSDDNIQDADSKK